MDRRCGLTWIKVSGGPRATLPEPERRIRIMASIIGTPASEILVGTAYADTIRGRGGNDRFRGLAGSDILHGDSGRDWFDGGGGNDTIRGRGGNDRAFGGDGADRIELGPGHDFASAQNGNDTVFGGRGDDVLKLGLGDDWADGGDGADTITGAAGRDRIYGGQGDDLLIAGAGDDVVSGQDGNDALFGGHGSDRLTGGGGDDTLYGDRVVTYQIRAMTDGRDLLLVDDDTLQWHHLDFAAVGRHEGLNEPTVVTTTVDGERRLDQQEWIPEWSAPPPDEIRQEERSSIFHGLDPRLPDAPVDVRLEVLQAREQLTILDLPSADNGYALTLDFDDNVPGGHDWYEARVTVFEHAGSDDVLLGGAGADTLHGGGGADLLEGQAGRDTLLGGRGADRFLYRSVTDSPADGSHDLIEDFRRDEGDKVDLSAIDADTTRPGNQSFTWIGAAPLTGPGQLHVDFSADEPIVEGSTTAGAGLPDFRIHIRNLFDVTGQDFIL
jgi:Ca2+-binding RTX toxin-like protein